MHGLQPDAGVSFAEAALVGVSMSLPVQHACSVIAVVCLQARCTAASAEQVGGDVPPTLPHDSAAGQVPWLHSTRWHIRGAMQHLGC